MADLVDRLDRAETSEFCVCSDLADTFLLGMRPNWAETPEASLLDRKFLLLEAYWDDLSSVGVSHLDWGLRGVMKPYRSTSPPSTSSQSSMPPASSYSFRMASSALDDKELAERETARAEG